MFLPITAAAVASWKWIVNETSIEEYGHTARSISLSGDGTTFAVGGDTKVKIYDFYSQNVVTELPGTGAFGNTVSMSVDGKRLAVGDYLFGCCIISPGKIHIYEKINDSWQETMTITGPDGTKMGKLVSISDDGKRIATGYNAYSNDKKIRIYEENDSDWAVIKTFEKVMAVWFSAAIARLSGDGKVVAINENDEILQILSIDNSRLDITESMPNLRKMSISHDGGIVACTVSNSKNAYVYNTTSQNPTDSDHEFDELESGSGDEEVDQIATTIQLSDVPGDISVSSDGHMISVAKASQFFKFDGGEWTEIEIKARTKDGSFKSLPLINSTFSSLSNDGTKALLVDETGSIYPFQLEYVPPSPPSPKKATSSSSNTLRPPYWLFVLFFGLRNI